MYETLHKLQQDGSLVDLRRESIDRHTTRCFVTSLTADFSVLAQVNDNCEFNGVSVVRTEDVSFVRWDTDVLRSWARVLAESPSSPEPAGFVDLASWESIVRTINDRIPVITFQRERANDDICHVGTGIEVRSEGIEAQEISIEGAIDGRFALAFDDLTRIDFGGGYERALWRMVRKAGRSGSPER